MMKKITIGSLFSGIGGFELGLERGIPNSQTIWQVEQNKYCQSILRKHWKKAITCEYQAQTGFRGGGYWARPTLEPPFLHVADGVSDRLARLKALGNAIVPQCSEWVGRQIYKSGLLQFND